MDVGIRDFQVEHILIDNLQFLLGSSDSNLNDRFLRQDRFIQNLRTFINERGCHVTVIAHPRKEVPNSLLTISSLYGGGKVTQEADNVMLIQTESNSSVPKKYLQVVKNRHDGSLGTIDLKFKKDRLSFRPIDRELIVQTGASHIPNSS